MPMNWSCKTPYFANGSWHPCGRCVFCRINDKRNWSVRTLDEFRYYKNGCFVTLTYDDKKVKENPYDEEYYKKEQNGHPLVYSLQNAFQNLLKHNV